MVKGKKVGSPGGDARVRVRYDMYLPNLSFQEGENSWTLLAGTVISTLQGYAICKNWHLCGVCWEEC